jgi:hypothetical protein
MIKPEIMYSSVYYATYNNRKYVIVAGEFGRYLNSSKYKKKTHIYWSDKNLLSFLRIEFRQ